MTDLTLQEAIAEVKRAFPGINNPWTGEDFALNETADPIDYAIATILNAAASDELNPLADHKLAVAEAYRRAADSLLECSVWCDSQERTDDGWRNGVTDARKHHMARILALADTDALADLDGLAAALKGESHE